MFSRLAGSRQRFPAVVLCLAVLGFAAAEPFRTAHPTTSFSQSVKEPPVHLTFVREFSSADDVTHALYPALNKTLDIVAGPADAHATAGRMLAPYSVTTDSTHRIFVADPDAGVVHVFDFEQSKYSFLKGRGARLRSPTAIAVDRDDNVYVTDTSLGSILVYDAKGRFLRYIGKVRGGESYFQSPMGIAIDAATDHIYVCDSRRHMVILLDKKGHILGHFGKRWGGKGPGDFRCPSRIAIAGDEIFVLDSGNSRLQILDLGGHFRREIKFGEVSADAGLALDSNKNIYVSDIELNAINVFNCGGQFLYKFGRGGTKPGEFAEPSGLWIESGKSLYVADTKNKRVQQFDIEGEQLLK